MTYIMYLLVLQTTSLMTRYLYNLIAVSLVEIPPLQVLF